MDIITTDHLTKSYGKKRGIIDLNLAVKEGEFYGFIGPNGAGKSTTIRTLLGLMRPTSGSASIMNMDVLKNRQETLRNIGYIPSEAMFYSGVTVSEILNLSARLRRQDCREESRRLCERLQLDPGQKADELSLGNRKKVSIVCALQHCPKLYIFDEPTSGLDPLIQKEFFEILKERQAKGATIFFSSHILSEVQKYCSRAAVIREGKMIACGDIAELARTNARRITLSLPEDCASLLRLLRGPVGQTDGHQNSEPEKYNLKGIRDLKGEGNTVSFLYQGDMKELIQFLTQISLTDITITEPDLNEIFMHFYE
ncbi:ABC transporter ATP-binding protein [Mediterraneibacter glycyrrhizinilyticus]|uniref:ABC transporter ATP-binding protein n=1 Tax=Mediterraneibacter glycyrrhizinilyticus TaxID=342942 RepID=UPI0025A44AE0|nr:ABC transporter ATP-binding protein [Mediterraneibacter glycyrrhizinilyticus]MDM8209931.1 ABC transporter ATP-binding protein [Mediterraneibacter glycyrrhizinilyticus]